MALRTGLFGGTFDPVHNGHLAIARSFLNSTYIEELWILLTPYPPHKEADYHSKFEVRHEMLKLAFSSLDRINILTVENELPRPSYTYRTIQYLKENHPEREFLFCMGEDSLTAFHTWKKHKLILKEADLLVAERPGSDFSNVQNYILDQTHFVSHEPVQISSSQVRDRVHNKQSISDIVPEAVEHFITQQSLYQSSGGI